MASITQSNQQGDYIAYASRIDSGNIAYVENQVELTGNDDERTRWYENTDGDFVKTLSTWTEFLSDVKTYSTFDAAMESRDNLLESVYGENKNG